MGASTGAGTDTEGSCPAPFLDCSGSCVDTDKDRENCGSCGVACAPGEVCSAGSCGLSCQDGLTDCDGTCTDTDQDPANCGSCGTTCAAGEVCSMGACALSCAPGLVDCGGTCIDPNTDEDFCGASADCAGDNAGAVCAAGEICDGTGACAINCQAGFIDCGGTCVDPNTNGDFCGASGDCMDPNAGTACADGEVCDGTGTCALSCQAGLIDCGGTCVDPLTDEAFCGASDDCMGANAGTVCAAGEVCDGAGTCALSCQAGLVDCGGTCVDPLTDEAFCGATGDCMGGNAGAVCASGEVCDGSGTCALTCQAGLIDCGGTCIDPLTDEAFCGAMTDCMGGNAGTVCAAGEICDGTGNCTLSCQAGLIDCGGTCIDADSNPNYCGASGDCMGGNAGAACNADETCVAGGCFYTGCFLPPGFPHVIAGATVGYGDMVWMPNCDIALVHGNPRNLVVISAADGTQSVLASGIGGADLISLTYHATSGLFYVLASDGEIYSVDGGGTPTYVAATAQVDPSALTVAPGSFGAFGDQLIVVANNTNGSAVAIDPAGPTITPIGNDSFGLSDVTFGPDGTCWVSGGPDVKIMDPAGVFTLFATGVNGADAISLNPADGSSMVVAESGSDQVSELTIPGAVLTTIGPYDIDDGWFTSGLLRAADGFAVQTGETSSTIEAQLLP